MKFAKKVPKFLKILGVVLGLLLLGGLACLEFPTLVVNRPIAGTIMKLALRQMMDMKVTWSGFKTETKTFSLADKRVIIRIKDLCGKTDNKVDACIPLAEFAFRYRFKAILPKLVEVGPVRIAGGVIAVNLDALIQATRESPKSKPVRFIPPDFIKDTLLEAVNVEIKEFRIKTGKNAIVAKILVNNHGHDLTMDHRISVTNEAGGKPLADLTVKFNATNASGKVFGPWGAKGSMTADLGKQGNGKVDFDIVAENERHYRYTAASVFESAMLLAKGQLVGTMKEKGFEGTLGQDVRLKSAAFGAVSGVVDSVSHVGIDGCTFGFLQVGDTDRSKTTFHCPVFVKVPRLRSKRTEALAGRLKLADRIVTDLKSELDGPFPLDFKKPFAGPIAMSTRPFLGSEIEFKNEIAGTLSLILINLPKFEKFSADLDTRTGIPDFARLTRVLNNTAAAIPAPFHSLRGNGHFSAGGHFDPHVGDITFRWQSRLASEEKTQRGSVDGGATLKFMAATDTDPGKMDVKAELILTDVRFSAPKLALGGPPQVFPDPRLSAKAVSESLNQAAKRAGSSLTYVATIRTKDRPVEFASSLTDAPMPVFLNFTVHSPDSIKGDINIEKFPLNVLGLKKDIGKIAVKVDTHEKGKITKGRITVTANEETTRVFPEQLAGQAAGQASGTRKEPKFSVPIVALASTIFMGVPLNEISVDPTVQARSPEPSESDRQKSQLLKVRKRF